MVKIPETQLQAQRFSEAWFENIFQALDQLHDAVSADRLAACSPLAREDALGWLDDIIYTAQECRAEIRRNTPGDRDGR